MKVKDIYTESVRQQFATRLTEAKAMLTKLKEGQMKEMMHKDAERLSREKFLDKYPGEGYFWDNINKDLDEGFEKSGVRADNKKGKIEKSTRKQYFVKLEKDGKMKGMTVTADEGENSSAVRDRVARDTRSTGWSVAGIRAKDTVDEAKKGDDVADKKYLKTAGKKPGVVGKAIDTAKQAGKFLAGKGGPGKEGPTYEGIAKKVKKVKEDPNEGNEFSGELVKARAQGAKEFKVDGKSYPVKEGEQRMSRAAKGYEKYGKAGMTALAKAGREGKDLDKVRDKYNKYDESAKPDFLDMDKDGDKKEPMKKAAADKGGAKTSAKKGMSAKQAKYFGKKAEAVEEAAKKGLYYNVNKRKAAGTSRSASSPKAPTAQAWKDAAKTAKKEDVAEVAGAQKCWPGHRKVGTQPGTGKNAGKRVNDCEKIKETVAESADLTRLKSLTKYLLG